MTKTLLIIDDNEDFRLIASSLLLDAGYDVWEASCPKSAFSILKTESVDLIICDLHMPFSTDDDKEDFVTESYEVGVRTVSELVWVFPDIPIVALSAASASDLKKISKYLDPVQAFSKPESTTELLSIVQQSLSVTEPRGLLQ